MKEHPILFSAPMVRAILDGSKMQTRRIVKPQPSQSSDSAFIGMDGIWRFSHPTLRGPVSHEADDVRCPYGQVGDQLWLREAWRIGAWDEDEGSVALDYLASNSSRSPYLIIPESADPNGEVFERYWKQSSGDAEKSGLLPNEDGNYWWQPGQSPCRKRPSIYMPRWASRIQLEITGVRVERLQDISNADAKAEGSQPFRLPCHPAREQLRYVDGYHNLWESINGAGSWAANPWVWVIEFRKL